MIKKFSILFFIFFFLFSNFASASSIKWFFSTSPFERKNNEIQLEWAVEGGGGSKLQIDCQAGKIRFADLGSAHIYNCGESLLYSDKQIVYALALMPIDNKDWATVRFILSVDGDQKSFEMGFASSGKFDRDLYFGLGEDGDVKNLQKLLTDIGLYNGPITGNFFEQTRDAVKKFQRKNGIKDTGYVGPVTRLVLNK
ncbi:MAG: peptidoglycan-binding domain-containing protein [Patescibacteria group bacterium]